MRADAIRLTPMRAEEIDELTALMGAAFDADARVYGMADPEPLRCYHSSDLLQRWPPGCVDAERFTIWADGQIAGAAVVWGYPGEVAVLGLLFVCPARQGLGAGSQVWHALEERYPAARRWLVAAPGWSPRTQHFYEHACGFTACGCDGAYVSYRKEI